MTIQSKYTVSKGLVETGVADTEDPKFHVSGVGLSFDLETVSAGHYEITCIASTQVDGDLGSLNGKTFTLDSGDGLVSFVIQNHSEVPAGANVIDVGTGAQANTAVATDVANIINGLPGFAAAAENQVVTVQCLKTGKTAQESLGLGNTGFELNVLNEGSGQAGGVISPTGVSIIDYNNDATVLMTLGDLTLDQAGTIKFIKQTHANTGVHTLRVAKHVTSQPEDFGFDADGEQLSLIWLGDKWATLLGRTGTDKNTALPIA